MTIFLILWGFFSFIWLICSYYIIKEQGYATPFDIFFAIILATIPIIPIVGIVSFMKDEGFLKSFGIGFIIKNILKNNGFLCRKFKTYFF